MFVSLCICVERPMGKIFAKKTRFSIAAKRVNAGRFNALRSCEIKRWQTLFSYRRFASFSLAAVERIKPASINTFRSVS